MHIAAVSPEFRRKRSNGHTVMDNRQHEQQHKLNSSHIGNHTDSNVWRSTPTVSRNQHHTIGQHYQFRDYLHNHRCSKTLDFRNSHKAPVLSYRTARHYKNNRNHLCNNSPKRFLSIALALVLAAAPAARAEDETNNVSNPVSSATGNVTNQNLNFNNNGAPFRQSFRPGHSCAGPVLTVQPFFMGNDSIPMKADGYVRSGNWGIQMAVMVPLDSELTDLCKDLARKRLIKEDLDYHLVRMIKCAELIDKGLMVRPGSPVWPICSDVVSIAAWQKSTEPHDRESLPPSLEQK